MNRKGLGAYPFAMALGGITAVSKAAAYNQEIDKKIYLLSQKLNIDKHEAEVIFKKAAAQEIQSAKGFIDYLLSLSKSRCREYLEMKNPELKEKFKTVF